MKVLLLPVKKLWLRLKFLKSRSNFKIKVTRSKFMVRGERSCHKEWTSEIWKPYLHVHWLRIYSQGLKFLCMSTLMLNLRLFGIDVLWCHTEITTGMGLSHPQGWDNILLDSKLDGYICLKKEKSIGFHQCVWRVPIPQLKIFIIILTSACLAVDSV